MRQNKFDRSVLVVLAGSLLLSACSVMNKLAPGRDKVDYK